MKAVSALCLIFAIGVAHCGLLPAATLVRTPSLDSAIIKSDRLGGNFAYSTVEGHAYAAINPVVQRITEPVAVSYTAHQVPLGYAAAPVAVNQQVAHTFISQPLVSQQYYSSPVLSAGLLAHPGLVAHVPSVGFLGHPGFVAQAPVVAPVAAPATPVVAPQADAVAPAQDAVVSDDAVSVESA